MRKQIKVRKQVEKANIEIVTPKNLDFLEISMPNEELDLVAQKNSALIDQRNDPVLRRKMVRRQERLLKKIFKAAAQVLTENQFNIFVQAYVYQLPDGEIAKQLGRHQTHITQTLRWSIKKVQKKLRVPISLKEFSRGRRKQDE
jgi:DNA-directed RNA polymerase specialized sigma24 family protein